MLQGTLDIALGRRHGRSEPGHIGRRGRIAGCRRQSVSVFEAGRGARQVGHHVLHGRAPSQDAGTQDRRHRTGHGHDGITSPASLAEVAVQHPEPGQREDQAARSIDITDPDEPVLGAAEVSVLLLQGVQPVPLVTVTMEGGRRPLGLIQGDRGVAIPDERLLAALHEPLEQELPDRLEHREPSHAADRGHDPHEVQVGDGGEVIDDGACPRPVPVDGFGALQAHTAVEDGQAPQQPLPLRREAGLIAPRDGLPASSGAARGRPEGPRRAPADAAPAWPAAHRPTAPASAPRPAPGRAAVRRGAGRWQRPLTGRCHPG